MSSQICTEYRACDTKAYSKATVFCIQCNSLQCISCDKEIHRSSDCKEHERVNLDQIDNEFCTIDHRHPAIFYCPTCASFFCYTCYVKQHKQSNKRKHRPQKFREEQVQSTGGNSAEYRSTAKPMYPDLSANVLRRNSNSTEPSAPTFQDDQFDNHNKHKSSVQSKLHTPNNPRLSEQQDHVDEHMFDENSEQNASTVDTNGVVLLLDGAEHLNVRNNFDFFRQLKVSSQDPLVKCVSIIGNTGDGKSHTLNEVFFNGEEKFCTSAKSDSCTMGVWAALDETKRTLVLDTEGRLGLSQNDNVRNRLLLKIMCVSDVVIFRTKAPRLPNDMFQFLSDASNAFLKYFQKELENVMKNSKMDGPMSAVGPTLIVFHETQHTEVLKDHFQRQRTAVEQLKERFEKMELSYDAYRSLEYVGIQTSSGRRTDFSRLKAAISAVLDNNNVRSPRRLSVVYKALKALNEKFNHAIPPEMPSTLPDDFFTCCVRCLSCGTKCKLASNHQKENIPHHGGEQCSYNKELDNEIMKCVRCDREGQNTIVYGKLIARNDSLVEGIVKYVWSGFVIECPKHGEVYRSRRYWYGNDDPKTATRIEVVHIWPGDDVSRAPSDVTPRKVIQAIRTAGSYISGSAKVLTETLTDQIAPSYWVPNRDSQECSACKLQFGVEFSKHHCRACGYTFCDTCTTHRAIVPLLDSQTAERVCDGCFQNIQSQTLSSVFQNNESRPEGTELPEYENNSENRPTGHGQFVPTSYNIPMSRRIVDLFQNNVASVVYDYSSRFIEAGTRPKYWRPDNECLACFICQHPFNSTTHRLHHCRRCGEGVCDSCSPNKRPVPERDWSTPERVCKTCDQAMIEADNANE